MAEEVKVSHLPMYTEDTVAIYEQILEIAVDKKFAPKEIYSAISRFTHGSFLFHNLLKYSLDKTFKNSLTAILYLPYTPQIILKRADDPFILKFAKYLNLKPKPLQVLRQKLLDIWYTAEDGEDFHMVVACRSRTATCAEPASQFCKN